MIVTAVDHHGDLVAVVDTAPLPVDAECETTSGIIDDNPYVPEEESVSASFTVIERTASFDNEDELTVPPSEATLSGTYTVTPGTVITVVTDSAETNYLDAARTTVEEDGSWTATFDFSELEPDTSFSARVIGLTDDVKGRVRSSE